MLPTMPERLGRKTANFIISQRVAESASAASFCNRGTVLKISRHREVMVGIIIKLKIKMAVSMPMPKLLP